MEECGEGGGIEECKLKIMLSGFDAEAERTYMTNIIKRLGGVYLNDDSNPQAFVPSCTHIICKKPNRSEKYLAGCASGKWILTPYFLHNSGSQGSWASEEDYEWGVSISAMYSATLQQAPRRWRETIKIKNRDPPFLGWSVGLVMKQSFVQAYTRIIEAGGGAAVDISSWYSPESANREIRTVNQGLLTHILVTPNMIDNVTKFRTEEILYLKAEYLAQFLLNESPPNTDRYSLFHGVSASDKYAQRRLAGVGQKSKAPILEYQSGDETESSHHSFGSGMSAEVLRHSPSKEGQNSSTPHAPSTPKLVQFDKPVLPTPVSRIPGQSDGPSSPKPSKCVITTVKVPTNKQGKGGAQVVPIAIPSLQERSLFKTFETSQNLLNVAGAGLVRQGSKEQAIHLQDIRKSSPKTNQRQAAPGNVPDITLGKKRTDHGKSVLSTNKGNSFKQNYSDDFFNDNFSILQEFAGLKKHHDTPYGMVEDLFAIETKIKQTETTKERCARPFSRDIVTSLEASLEVNYRPGYLTFLKEVSGRVSANVYPPPDVIYVIMKVILLDTDNPVLASSAFAVLKKIMELHPPQSPDIKAAKLYHKAFTVMTIPDEAEPSPIMLAVGCMLSQTNEDWSLWCNRDPVLGPHWTFYSRVLHVAISAGKPKGSAVTDESADDALSRRKRRNAVLLTFFLTKLAEKDYEDVITRSDFPTNNPMIKCLIADLLWPAMTGLEPWFRRPSPNLADLVSLFVKAVEIRVSHSEAEYYGEDDDIDDVGSDDEEIDDENSQVVLNQISRLITVTASWCVYCDLREKERGKRSASRPLEFELVKSLRSELEEVKPEVLELALESLPPRLRLKVNAALITEACSEDLVAEEAKTDPELGLFEELSLEIITSRYMQLLPLPAESETEGEAPKEKYSKPSDPKAGKKSDADAPLSAGQAHFKALYKVNRRNAKGETPLHIACMQNKPEVVRQLLAQPGINPNLTDYAGWTPLGEACNHGHIRCVEELLQLPVKQDLPLAESDGPPILKIDITLCPQEGQTPLHDALGNGHLDIACLLLEKGGTELLDKVDSGRKTPLDCCASDAARAYMIEYACKLAVEERQRKEEADLKAEEDKVLLMSLSSEETYEKVLSNLPSGMLTTDSWRGKVRWYFWMTSLLVSHYVTSGYLIRACFKTHFACGDSGQKNYHVTDDVVVIEDSDDERNRRNRKDLKKRTKNAHSNISTSGVKQFANDVTYCLKWQRCWNLYKEHVKRLVGGDSDVFETIVKDCNSPIPNDWMSDLPPP